MTAMTFPNPGVTTQAFTFRDAKGFTGTTRVYLNVIGATDGGVAGATALRTAIVPLTNAALQSAHGPLGEVGTFQYGSTSVYQPIYVHASMLFQDAYGGLHRYRIPAPKQGIFLADGMTVNPANADVLAWVNEMLTGTGACYACSRSGTALLNFFGGVLVNGKPRRRYGLLQLTPTLTPEEPGE